MEHQYQVGQNIYTSKKIRGWFDYSMQIYIPENTPGTIVVQYWVDGHEEPSYAVKFSKEFGTQTVSENELKLG